MELKCGLITRHIAKLKIRFRGCTYSHTNNHHKRVLYIGYISRHTGNQPRNAELIDI